MDFCCQKPRLIIELDGGCHNQDEKQKSDKVRDKKLSDKGYTILRFWNNEIDDNIEGVLEIIEKNIKRPLPGHRRPSPTPGEGNSEKVSLKRGTK